MNFVTVVHTTLTDVFPKWFRHGHRPFLLVAEIALTSTFLGLIMATDVNKTRDDSSFLRLLKDGYLLLVWSMWISSSFFVCMCPLPPSILQVPYWSSGSSEIISRYMHFRNSSCEWRYWWFSVWKRLCTELFAIYWRYLFSIYKYVTGCVHIVFKVSML